MSMEIDAHTVVPDADAAAGWYAHAFGANVAQHLGDVPAAEVAATAARMLAAS